MDLLVKLPAVLEGKNVCSLRRFVGQVEVINRGLHTLSVDQSTFGSLLIPILLGKLPEDIKSQVTRFISLEIWNLKELLDLLNKDVEARDKCGLFSTECTTVLERGASDITAGSFVTRMQIEGCVFCNGNHTSHKCLTIPTPKEWKMYLVAKGRCFKCLEGDHLSGNCKVRGSFRYGKENHPAICFKAVPTTRAGGNRFSSSRGLEISISGQGQ